MLVPFPATIATKWFRAACHLHQAADPAAFRPRRIKQLKHQLSQLPCVPEFYLPHRLHDPARRYTRWERAEFFTLLSALRSSVESSVTPITSDDIPICLDSGASMSVCNNLQCFRDGIRPVANGRIEGIHSGLQIEGIGTATYVFEDIHGQTVEIPHLSLYVPQCPINLLPPQQLIAAPGMSSANRAEILSDGIRVTYNGHHILFPYDPQSNLPIQKLQPGASSFIAACLGTTKLIHPLDAAQQLIQEGVHNTNLSPAMHQLLTIHERYGHLDMTIIQRWAAKGLHNLPKSISRCKIPLCKSCLHGGMRRRSHPSESTSIAAPVDPENPGDFVSTDQMISKVPGLMPFTSGCPSTRRYSCATIFVDSTSQYVHSTLQESTSAVETIASKISFESFARDNDVTISHYRCDNGVYQSKAFVEHIRHHNQSQSFSGIGAHWQNGIAERHIGSLTRKARIMLLHAMSRWPSVITASFWSFAWQLAVHQHNHLPQRDAKLTRYERFTLTDDTMDPNNYHTFGSPVYVLDPAIADGKPVPKWSDRCYLGVYVGVSPHHASTVALVYNPVTKLTSPAYHCVFDDAYTTVSNADSTGQASALLQDFIRSLLNSTGSWHHQDAYSSLDDTTKLSPILSASVGRKYHSHAPTLQEQRDTLLARKRLAKSTLTRAQQALSRARKRSRPLSQDPTSSCEGVFPAVTVSPNHTSNLCTSTTATLNSTPTPSPVVPSDSTTEDLCQPQALHDINDAQTAPASSSTVLALLHQLGLQLSPGATLLPISTVTDTHRLNLQHVQAFLALHAQPSAPPPASPPPTIWDDLFASAQHVSIDDTLNLDMMRACAAGTKSSPDVLSQAQMLRAEDCDHFFACQADEISTLQDATVFGYLPRTSLPEGANVLKSIWSYRRKRRPDGTLLKYKSRICADGSMQQHGIDYWESYAPVVQWSTVRICIVLAAMLGLTMTQIDFTQAFTQADLDEDVFMTIPQGWYFDPSSNSIKQSDDPRFLDTEHIIKLLKNLYGTVQAARNWYHHLRDALLSPTLLNFKSSVIDPCLFIRNDCLVVVYTDDCIVFGHNSTTVNKVKSDLAQAGFLFREEGTLEDFLGIRFHYDYNSDGSLKHITMTQTGLIDSILRDVGLLPTADDSSRPTPKFTPALGPLRSDPDGPPCDASWNYSSIIGKLNFLAQNTRIDICFAVHQCARFAKAPKKSHQTAVKHLCRYLYYTRNRGLIFTPNHDHRVEAYCDADFAGLYHRDTAHLRESALSRSGFIITYAGCPVIWTSKLQTEVALSTCESEYICLSTCVRSIIPLRTILHEITNTLRPLTHIPALTKPLPQISTPVLCRQHQSIIHEDNVGALEIAVQDTQYRPRTKHISVKWHRFRDHIASGELTVRKIDTKLQWADFLTKALPRPDFERLRKFSMGW